MSFRWAETYHLCVCVYICVCVFGDMGWGKFGTCAARLVESGGMCRGPMKRAHVSFAMVLSLLPSRALEAFVIKVGSLTVWTFL